MKSLLSAFNDPSPQTPNLGNSKDELMQDDSNNNFELNLVKQLDFSDSDDPIKKRQEKSSNKFPPPPLYAKRQFSFIDPQSIGSSNIFKEKEITDSLACRKNLFGNDEENKDPNYDMSMSSSPDKDKIPFDAFIEDALNQNPSM